MFTAKRALKWVLLSYPPIWLASTISGMAGLPITKPLKDLNALETELDFTKDLTEDQRMKRQYILTELKELGNTQLIHHKNPSFDSQNNNRFTLNASKR